MLKIEARQMFRSNGLIDDFAVYGAPDDYLQFAKIIKTSILSEKSATLGTNSTINLEIVLSDNESQELFTSLQNESDEYFSMKEWQERKILRIVGSEKILNELHLFLVSLSSRGEGYSYISEYSENYKYSNNSPEWRLHVENT